MSWSSIIQSTKLQSKKEGTIEDKWERMKKLGGKVLNGTKKR